ncbi:MAG: Ku protein, partial [Actinobacteria bacterium]|nr:Ku protein [Actinomycetota bacterium]NIU64036.1 Ku protein [Actinomycetota bacterium]NIV85444.1 Ku protein [Actinomycetota bacterium]
PSSDKVIDLMAALEASVKEAKKARGRHPASGRRTTEAKAAKKAAAKKAAAKKAGTRAKKAGKRAKKSA